MVWGAVAMIGAGVAGNVAGGLLARRGQRKQQDSFRRAAEGFGEDTARIGDEEIALTRQQMQEYSQLAGGYRDALRTATNRFSERAQQFQSGIGSAMDGLQGAEQTVFGMSGVPSALGDTTWEHQRSFESAGRQAPARELAATMMSEDGLRNYDQQTGFGMQNALAGLQRSAGQSEQRGMLGRALLDQNHAMARQSYQNAIGAAQHVGQGHQVLGQLGMGIGNIALAQGIGRLGSSAGSGGEPTNVNPTTGGALGLNPR